MQRPGLIISILIFLAINAYGQIKVQDTIIQIPDHPADTSDIIYMVAEEMASFPGGQDALMKYLYKNLVYPQEAIDSGFAGYVYVQFVVEKDGAITHAKVREGAHPMLVEVALKAVNGMPKWNPAKQRGKPVRSIFILPVHFDFSREEKIKESQ